MCEECRRYLLPQEQLGQEGYYSTRLFAGDIRERKSLNEENGDTGRGKRERGEGRREKFWAMSAGGLSTLPMRDEDMPRGKVSIPADLKQPCPYCRSSSHTPSCAGEGNRDSPGAGLGQSRRKSGRENLFTPGWQRYSSEEPLQLKRGTQSEDAGISQSTYSVTA